jgi:6-phosphogluconolactonase
MTPTILVHQSPEQLAAAAAARLITRLVDLQSDGLIPSVALTGGGIGIAVLREVAASPARDAVDWRSVEFFWGDERFVPAGSDERNEKQAREALLDHVNPDPVLVHAMAPSDGEFGDDPDAAAAGYARLLADRAPLDIVLLGMGPEGHVASVFPHSPAVHAPESVVAVRDCP